MVKNARRKEHENAPTIEILYSTHFPTFILRFLGYSSFHLSKPHISSLFPSVHFGLTHRASIFSLAFFNTHQAASNNFNKFKNKIVKIYIFLLILFLKFYNVLKMNQIKTHKLLKDFMFSTLLHLIRCL